MRQKKLFISGLIALSFLLLIASIIFYIDNTRDMRRIDPLELESMQKEQIIQTIYERQANEGVPFYYFIPIFGFLGVGVGAVIYFINTIDLEKKEKIIEHNTDIILKLVDPEERKVINKIVENNGKTQQMEITYMEGYTKVKAHRIIEGLVRKGILTKEAMGKMRQIKLDKDLYEILKKK